MPRARVWFAAQALLLFTAFSQTALLQSETKKNPPSALVSSANQLSGINASRAMEYVREIVSLGPRPVGSAGHQKQEAYIRKQLHSDHLEEDIFAAPTPVGVFEMKNIIAKYPGTKDGIIILGSHYDTVYSIKNFVGANDGGSSTGLLLELANHFRGRKREGYSIWLVFFDGEEAFRQWSASDSLYGSRHLAGQWQQNGTAKRIKAFLLADMIGDRDLNIERETNSTPWLLDLIGQAAGDLTYRSYFYGRQTSIEDDHLPFAKIGVPVADIIDLDYGFNNIFHHTAQDTLDKLSAKSLQIVGDVILRTVQLLDAR